MEWYMCDKCEPIERKLECLFCHKVEAGKYLFVIRYADTNAVTQNASYHENFRNSCKAFIWTLLKYHFPQTYF